MEVVEVKETLSFVEEASEEKKKLLYYLLAKEVSSRPKKKRKYKKKEKPVVVSRMRGPKLSKEVLRQVLWLKNKGGTYKEIQKQTGIPEGSISRALRLARQRIKEMK